MHSTHIVSCGQFWWLEILHNLISIQQGFKVLLGRILAVAWETFYPKESKVNQIYKAIREELLAITFFFEQPIS